MFAAANIRNQNPLQNETSLLLLLENVTFSPVSFLNASNSVCALLCLTAIGIDFLFIEFSFCSCLSWDL